MRRCLDGSVSHSQVRVSLHALLLLPRISDSIHYRAYLETVGDQPFLARWLRHFRKRYPGLGLTLVCHTLRQESEVHRALGSAMAKVARTERGTTLQCAALAAESTKARDIALLALGFAYAPRDLLSRLHSFHRRSGNSHTFALGLPPATAPELYRREFLIRISKLRVPGLPTIPRAAAEAVRAAGLLPVLGPIIMRVPGDSLSFLEGRRRAWGETPVEPRSAPRTLRVSDTPTHCVAVAGCSPASSLRSSPSPPSGLQTNVHSSIHPETSR